MKNTGQFLKWISLDVQKESEAELAAVQRGRADRPSAASSGQIVADDLEASLPRRLEGECPRLTWKQVNKSLSTVARKWYTRKIQE